MGIPSTKASTANVDSPTDYIADARADIKQNIDNVNEIIDHLTDSVTQKYAQITGTNTEQNVSGNIYRKAVTVGADLDSLVTNSTYTFSLPAGKYLLFVVKGYVGGDGVPQVLIHDEDADSQLGAFSANEVATTNTSLYAGAISFELSSTTNLSYRVNSSVISARNDANCSIMIHKFA